MKHAIMRYDFSGSDQIHLVNSFDKRSQQRICLCWLFYSQEILKPDSK